MTVRAVDYGRDRVESWRNGSAEGQWFVAVVLLSLLVVAFLVSWVRPDWMPLAAYFLMLVVATMLLRFGPLLVVAAADAVAGVGALAVHGPITGPREVAMVLFVVTVVLVVFVSSLSRSGLPVPLGSALLVDLKNRVQAQGRVPSLPEGWECQNAMLAAHGVNYAGDFMVARLSDDRRRLELVLVDVCGKGTTAGPAAIAFSGALSGLIGAGLTPPQLFAAANDFLIRQDDDEAFATAVHVAVDLADGCYTITSAGHPPALRWDVPTQEWILDNARGTALGVLPVPELEASQGRLFPGEALLFYTDGVVEGRASPIDSGIAWLQSTAAEAIGHGFDGAVRRIIGQIEGGDDDRAVLMLTRASVEGSPPATESSPARVSDTARR